MNTRTPEQGHSAECLAYAINAAIGEKYLSLTTVADGESPDYVFRIWAQDNGPLHRADETLKSGEQTCYCD